ncbi:uncharacterized protein PRCAT00000507001 [Priceomyces carsonii]|uniref:uncharacterized protein n=1 Tax=Priceomyces carsonii TaxID=28549 RepID=UPI002ED7E835|nr:unnamed protein product [Priceomyces carsonii]
MTSYIDINNKVPIVEANLVPFHIEYSGPANTAEFFTPSKTTEQIEPDREASVAYFRGCKMVGNEVTYGDRYIGYVVEKSEKMEKIQEDESIESGILKNIDIYTAVAKFKKLVIYGHDAPAEEYNQWALVNEWKEISDIVHS